MTGWQRFALTALASMVAAACGLDASTRYVTPLASAAREGHVEHIEWLLRDGADIEEPSGVNGWTPLMHAVHKGQVAAAERLLERGASLEGPIGRQALLMAAAYGHLEMVRLLLAHGVDPAADGVQGRRVMLNALGGPSLDPDPPPRACAGRVAVMRALLERSPRLRVGGGVRASLVLWYTRFTGCSELAALAEGGI